MKHTWTRVIGSCCCCLLLASCAELGISLPGRGPGVGTSGDNPALERGSPQAAEAISRADARKIARDLGLTGYRALPPGIARNLAKGKALPPGIAKQVPPQNMLALLPVIAGHEWQVAGRDLLLIAIGTAIVVEILEDVFE